MQTVVIAGGIGGQRHRQELKFSHNLRSQFVLREVQVGRTADDFWTFPSSLRSLGNGHMR